MSHRLSPEQCEELRALLNALDETVKYHEFLNATAQAVTANADNTATANATE
jgi:hypothetical protein